MNNRCSDCKSMFPRKGCNNPDVNKEKPTGSYNGFIVPTEYERYTKTNCKHFVWKWLNPREGK